MSLVDNTVTVKRGGSYLTVPATAIDRYLAKGYVVVDEHDNVIQSGKSDSVDVLKAEIEKRDARIKELESELAKYKKPVQSETASAETTVAPKKTTAKKRT